MRVRLLGFIALCASVVCAQEFRGAFSGTVTDQQGAVIPKARVVATETRTGTRSETFSEPSGQYTLPFLAPGEYEITAEAAGFKKYVRQGLTLGMGEHPALDIRLEIGEATQSVTVVADAPLLETTSGSAGQVITTEEVEDFPLNGRTPLMLAQLAMGVIPTGEPGSVKPFDNGGASSFSVAGAPNQSNELLLNGAPDGTWDKRLAYSPPQDSVQEVRVQAFESDAAYGHTGGGTANHITKSGTNKFHGSAYEFNQVSKLSATEFFTNKAGLRKTLTRVNQYGLTAGGPVMLPKLFNGKNRLFWFFAYEGIRDSTPNSVITTVPTLEERKGDFSALLKAGANYQIYDPMTGVVSGTRVQRDPFPNNIIPASRLNPVAQAYMKYYPDPNMPGRVDGFNNYGSNNANTDGFDNELGRLDFNLSDRHKLSWDFRHNYRVQTKNNFFANPATGNFLDRTNWGSAIDDVYTLTPTTVMNVRASWTRFIEDHRSNSGGIDPTTLGFPSYIAGTSQYPAIPYLSFGSCGSRTSYNCIGMKGDSFYPYDIYQIFADVVKIRGNQSIKVGGDLRSYRMSAMAPGYASGSYTFKTKWANGPLSNAAAAPLGQDLASFMLGLPDSGSFDLNAQSTAESRYYAFFIQDDWRARSNLTINAGLRWEHETPTTERFGRVVNGFDPAAPNPISAAAVAAYAKSPVPQIPVDLFKVLGGLTFATPQHPNIYSTNTNNFSPRVGFAWVPAKLGARTVVRGGFGLFVAPVGINGSQDLNQEGFSQTTQFQATTDNYLSPAGTLSNPFPRGIVQPAGSSRGTGTFLGQSITFFNPEVHNSYSIRWNFGIQRQLPGQVVLEIGYIGNHAVRLPVDQTQLNYIPRSFLSTAPVRDQAVKDLLDGTVANPLVGLLPNSTSLNGKTVALRSLLLPFPQFPGIIMQNNAAGSSYYHSLNVRLQKRMSHGLSLMNNFIWSKVIERMEYLNPSDPMPEKRIGADSRPLREVIAMTYQLPVGHGKRIDFGSGLKNALLGGWTLNTIFTWQIGPVLDWGGNNAIYFGGDIRLNPRYVDGPAIDVTRFNTNSSYALSDNIRTFSSQFNNLRRDATNNVDVSMLKNFQFAERKYLQLRFESFNTLNRPVFGNPNVSSSTSTAFGMITEQSNQPRRIQMGARLVW